MSKIKEYQASRDEALSRRAHLTLRGVLEFLANTAARLERAAQGLRARLDPKGGAADVRYSRH